MRRDFFPQTFCLTSGIFLLNRKHQLKIWRSMDIRCPCCGIYKDEGDFMGKDRCYKCILAEKLRNMPKTYRRCIICEETITTSRWTYCSEPCAKEGLDIRRKAVHSKFWLREKIEPNRRLRAV